MAEGMTIPYHRELEEDYRARMACWSDIQEQMPLLRAAARRYVKPVIAELGTRWGQSASALLAGAAATGGHVWSVDPGPITAEDGIGVSPWWHQTGLWSFLGADDLSEETARWLPVELDILFIDTTHRYAHTLAELRRYVPRVKPGGMVLMHDVELTIWQMLSYGEPGAVEDVGGPEYPVAAALTAFCAETGLTWTRQTERPAPAAGMPFYGLGTIEIPVKGGVRAGVEHPDRHLEQPPGKAEAVA